jgi:hypothetical protein
VSENDVVTILKSLADGISKHGVDKVTAYLKLMNIEYDDSDLKMLIDYTLTKVCLRYKVSVEDLLFTKKRGDVTTAKKMCICLLCEYIDRSIVSDLLSVTYQLVYQYHTTSPVALGAKSNADIQFINTYNELKDIIDHFKSTITLKTLND